MSFYSQTTQNYIGLFGGGGPDDETEDELKARQEAAIIDKWGDFRVIEFLSGGKIWQQEKVEGMPLLRVLNTLSYYVETKPNKNNMTSSQNIIE